MNDEQENQIRKQIAAYEAGQGEGEFKLLVNGEEFPIDLFPFVASPKVMNSGSQLAEYFLQRKELVTNKTVMDMGTGSGIVGIVCALLGAKKVYMPDIDKRAVENAQHNIDKLNLGNICEAFVSDLFNDFKSEEQIDVQIFNHPFFSDEPREGKEWTQMMLGGTELLGRYFETAHRYSTRDAIYVLSWLPLANNDLLDNNPSKRGREHGYEVTEVARQSDNAIGEQRGTFEIYTLKKLSN